MSSTSPKSPPESRRAASIALLVVLLSLPLLVRTPRGGIHFTELLNDFAHAPLFAAIAWLAASLVLPRTVTRAALMGRTFLLGLLLLAAGGLIELIQARIGRDASWTDMGNNLAGVLFGLALHHSKRDAGARRSRAPLAIMALATAWAFAPLLTGAVAYVERARRMPDLVSARGLLPLYFVEGREAKVAIDAAGNLEVHFAPRGTPGMHLWEVEPDWRRYGFLELELTNPGDAPVWLGFRVHDRAHDNRNEDRFNRSLRLEPGETRAWRWPLEEISSTPGGRSMDLSRMSGVVLFGQGATATGGGKALVRALRLE